jgi:hypothetical protein
MAAMASAFFRLLALVSMLLMPVGMAGAAPAAQPASVMAGHCDEQQEPAKVPAEKMTHCAACSALPAPALGEPLAELRPSGPRLHAELKAISGVEPEIGTPPPKRL